MGIQINFPFTQSNLQDFLECQRRFELLYILRVRWPARLQDCPENLRTVIDLGSRFHLLCQQYFLGISADLITKSIEDASLRQLWNNFLSWMDTEPMQGHSYPEISLKARIGGRQVMAKYDLIQVIGDADHDKDRDQHRYRIYDWKTSQNRHSRISLERKIQTTLYPVILALAGQNFSGNQQALLPENIDMTYWFACHPDNPEFMPYSRHKFEEDMDRIEDLISSVCCKQPGQFMMAENVKHCRYCTYRSMCDRPFNTTMPADADEEAFETALDGLLISFEQQLGQMNEKGF